MDKLISATIDYTRSRKTFGKPIIDNQAVHFRMAELHTEVELLRALLYRTVGMNKMCGSLIDIVQRWLGFF